MPTAPKIHLVENFTEGSRTFIDLMEWYPADQANVILNMSINVQSRTWEYLRLYPEKPLVVYCWDFYAWALTKETPYNWEKYMELLKLAKLVLVPSNSQQLRLLNWGIKSEVIVASVDVQEEDGRSHKRYNNRFVLDPVRDYPEENLGWVERACKELEIPYIHSEHQYSKEEFLNLIKTCSFLTCGYREASTGGLSLIEGLWYGKPSLVSNSPYMGARDYLTYYGKYFQYDDFMSLKLHLNMMWKKQEQYKIWPARNYIRQNFSPKVFANKLYDKITVLN